MMYANQIIMLCTLNLYSAGCQLHLNKTGRKKFLIKNKTRTHNPAIAKILEIFLLIIKLMKCNLQKQSVVHVYFAAENIANLDLKVGRCFMIFLGAASSSKWQIWG